MVTRSPSRRNVRVSPFGNGSGFDPRHDSSSRLPYEFGVGPLIVPVASRSPVRRLQPLTVWWASCWQTFQYRCFAFDRQTVCGPFDPAPRIATSRWTSNDQSPGERRYGSGGGSCFGPGTRNGSSAVSGTTHGLIDVPK